MPHMRKAEERTKQMWRVYRDFVQDVLAIPVVSGRKTESEKICGSSGYLHDRSTDA